MDRQPARQAEDLGDDQRRDGVRGPNLWRPNSPLSQSNRAAAFAMACAIAGAPAGAPSIRSCWMGSPPRSTTATAIVTPRRAASCMALSASLRAQSSSAWRVAGGAAAMPRLSAGSMTRSPNRCCPALAVVPVLALVGEPGGVGDQQVLGVGGPAVRAHRARVDVGREERADGRAGGGDAGHHHAVGAPDRQAAGAGEQRLGGRRREPGRDRRGDRRHPVQVLGARDLLGGRDPGLRPGPRHPAGAARVHPGRGEQGAARADDGDRAAQAELLGLVDRALDERAGVGKAEIARVARSGWLSCFLIAQAPTML